MGGDGAWEFHKSVRMNHNEVTPESLLIRLRKNESFAWSRFDKLYQPLILGWCQKFGVDANSADDLLQEVTMSVQRNIGTFEKKSATHAFRKWLYTITRNKANDHFRSKAKVPEAIGGTGAWKRIEDLPVDEPEEWTTGELSNALIVKRAIEMVRSEFEPKTFDAFWMSTIKGIATAEVCEQLSMSSSAVRKARFRVIHRLRNELADLVDELFR